MQKKIDEILTKHFEYIYCHNCANYCTDECDYCHRKNMQWSISQECKDKVIQEIMEVIENNENL